MGLKKLLASNNPGDDLRCAVFAYNDLDIEGLTEEEFDLDEGLAILFELADIFSTDQKELIMEKLDQFSLIEEEDLDESVDEEFEEEDGSGNTGFRGYYDESEALNEIKFRVRARSPKFKRFQKLKKRAKEKLGARKVSSLAFRAKNIFDTKKKQFVRRKNPLSFGALRKKAKQFKKLVKRKLRR